MNERVSDGVWWMVGWVAKWRIVVVEMRPFPSPILHLATPFPFLPRNWILCFQCYTTVW